MVYVDYSLATKYVISTVNCQRNAYFYLFSDSFRALKLMLSRQNCQRRFLSKAYENEGAKRRLDKGGDAARETCQVGRPPQFLSLLPFQVQDIPHIITNAAAGLVDFLLPEHKRTFIRRQPERMRRQIAAVLTDGVHLGDVLRHR